jgi:hypothetical protein
MYSLHTKLHYESRARGVGVPEREQTELSPPTDGVQRSPNEVPT